ncbi:helix-turn-helix domain-containing protein [Streptomyces boncukensis]|uniref:helix-turn-helix domain-containing protein n=1 Tax=Streptomyces boncukensis TaxID=2711219 RepID=UPI003B97455C
MNTSRRTTEESPHLTVAELAARWRTTEQAIYHRRHRRQLPPAISGGRKLLFPLAAIEAFERDLAASDPQNPLNDPAAAPVERRRGRPRAKAATA